MGRIRSMGKYLNFQRITSACPCKRIVDCYDSFHSIYQPHTGEIQIHFGAPNITPARQFVARLAGGTKRPLHFATTAPKFLKSKGNHGHGLASQLH
jgi:hypothetical protein